MAITYPLSFPSTIGISEFTLRTRSAVARTESPFSFADQVQVNAGQQWQCDVTIPLYNRDTAEDANTFLMKLNGREGTFLLGDPNANSPRGSVTTTVTVDGNGQTGGELSVTGLAASTAGDFKAGDFIQLGSLGTARLHKILNDVVSDGSGNATLDIWPNIRTSPLSGDTVTYTNAVGQWRLTSNEFEYRIDNNGFYSVSFSALEPL